jgi:hypothetical protein
MDLKKFLSAASATPPSAPATPSNGYPTDGNPSTATPATVPGAYWFYQLDQELRAILTAAGITPDHTNLTQLLSAIEILAPGDLIGVQVVTVSGTYTPTAGTKSVIVEAIGGGAGSGGVPATNASQVSLSYGGTAGSYGKARFTSAFSGVTVTVGAAGAAGSAAPGAGGNGGTTSFGALLSCPGGIGGTGGGVTTLPANTYGMQSQPAAPTGANILGVSGALPAGGVWASGAGSAPIVSYGGVGMLGPAGADGAGANGVYNGFSSPAGGGIAGTAGKVIIWEYS